MKIQFLTIAICIVAMGALQNFASAQSSSSGFVANATDAVSEAVAGAASEVVPDAVTNIVADVESDFVPEITPDAVSDAGSGVVSGISQADSSEIVSDFGESSYFDSQEYAGDCGCTSQVESFCGTPSECSSPQTQPECSARKPLLGCSGCKSLFGCCSAPEAPTGCSTLGSDYNGVGNAARFHPNRTFTILGGWDLGFQNEDFLLGGFFFSDEVELDRSNFAISVALGRRHRPWLRSESEIAVRDFDFNSQATSVFGPGFGFDRSVDISVFSLMRNAIVEWNNSSRFTPYGGAGIGVSYIEADEEFSFPATGAAPFVDSGDDTVFTWQVIAGVATQIRQNVRFITEYRYFATADFILDAPLFAGISGQVFDSQNLFFGLTVDF